MSLRWDISKCKSWKELRQPAYDMNGMTPLFGEDGEPLTKLDGLTEALIFASIVCGLGPEWELTEEYAPEFFARIKMLERMQGSLVWQDGKEYQITIEDIERRIGLETNASPVTRARFVKSILSSEMDALARSYSSKVSDPRAAAAAAVEISEAVAAGALEEAS